MKILIAADLYWPVINGISVFGRNLAKGMADRGHEVIVIAPSQTGKKYEEIDGNYKIIRPASTGFPFYQNIKISLTPYKTVKKIIDDFQPDVIHINMLLVISQSVMKYGNKCGIPIISTNHAMPENLMDNLKLLSHVSRPINHMIKRYGLRFYSKSDYLTMPTQAAIDMFKTETQKIHIPMEAVSNGIDLKRFTVGKVSEEIYKKYKIPTDVPIITFVGRTDVEKHIPVLIKAFSEVVAKTKAHLLIIGDGTILEDLQNLVNELNITKYVTFAGRVIGDDLVALHKVGTVFCMPSPVELQSIATLEAMASGQPVVAVDAGALKELCQNERNGYLCHADDEHQIAKALFDIVSNPKLRAKMSKESLAIADTHDLRKTLDKFESIYKQLIKNNKN